MFGQPPPPLSKGLGVSRASKSKPDFESLFLGESLSKHSKEPPWFRNSTKNREDFRMAVW